MRDDDDDESVGNWETRMVQNKKVKCSFFPFFFFSFPCFGLVWSESKKKKKECKYYDLFINRKANIKNVYQGNKFLFLSPTTEQETKMRKKIYRKQESSEELFFLKKSYSIYNLSNLYI